MKGRVWLKLEDEGSCTGQNLRRGVFPKEPWVHIYDQKIDLNMGRELYIPRILEDDT
jgi:hypothetical protein